MQIATIFFKKAPQKKQKTQVADELEPLVGDLTPKYCTPQTDRQPVALIWNAHIPPSS